MLSLVDRLPKWRCPHLLLTFGACSYWSIASTWRPQGAQQQTRRTPLLLSINGTDRRTDAQTDGRTPDRYTDPAPHTFRAVSASDINVYKVPETLKHTTLILIFFLPPSEFAIHDLANISYFSRLIFHWLETTGLQQCAIFTRAHESGINY